MASSNVQVVRHQFEALNRAGVEEAAGFWHPEISWRAVEGAVDDAGEVKGRAAMCRYYQDWVDMVDGLRGGIEQVLHDEGETLVVVVWHAGRGRGSSVPIHGRYCVVYTIREGLIVRGREYERPEQALGAAGLR